MPDLIDIFLYSIFIITLLWSHIRVIFNKEARSKLPKMLVLDGIALVFILTAYVSPKTHRALMQEDYIVEWITFYAFSICVLIIAIYLWQSLKRGSRVLSPAFLIPLLMAGFCLLIAGEEISWGQRIFSFKPPDFFLVENYQQELNLHNLFKGDGFWGIKVESKHLVMLIALFFGFITPLLTKYIPPLKHLNDHAPGFYLMPYFILVIAMEQIYPISFTGEACEMYLGLIFLIHIHETYPVITPTSGWLNRLYQPYVLLALIFLWGTVTVPALALLIYGSDADAEAAAMKELNLLKRDFRSPAVNKKRLLRKNLIHKRIYTAMVQKYFRLSKNASILDYKNDAGQQGRMKYFIDPWNNPYWVFYHKRSKTIIFYSFGSNRKRDSDVIRDRRLKGDDIGVSFSSK